MPEGYTLHMVPGAKVAVVTGGSSGIGLEVALQLAGKGVRVYVLSRNAPAVNGNLPSLISFIQTDVRQTTSILSAAARIKSETDTISFLINVAGIGGELPLEDVTDADYQDVFDTNVKGTIFTTQVFLPLIERGGVICQISSIAGIRGFADWSLYCASKFAVEGFTQSLRHEVRSRGIKVSVVRPGAVATPFYASLADEEKKDFMSAAEVGKAVVAVCFLEPNATLEEVVINTTVGDL